MDSEEISDLSIIPDRSIILLIDDEEMLLQLAQRFLEMAGFKTVGFSDSRQSMQWFADNYQKVALTILDLRMTGLDGEACFAQMMKIDPETKVAFLTGLVEPKVESELLNKGAVGFLKKPLRYPDLVEWIKNQVKIEQ